jgi:predicted Zn-dependent protease
MMSGRFRSLRFACVALVSLTFAVQPVLAQSVLRDAETEQFLEDITSPMAVSAGLQPRAVKLVLVNDPSINAFVAVGQMIFINSGTIQSADSANELEGVIAHELGHIETGGSALTAQDAAKAATRVTLLSLLLGAAAMAAGAGEAGMAAMMAGQSAAEGKFLAFSRAVEGSADASAVRHLNDSHYSGKGMISFFEKLRREEYRLTPSFTKVDEFAVDHPMTDDRLLALRGDLEKSPYWDAPVDQAKQARFLRIKAKLIGYLEEPRIVLNKYPASDKSIYGRYARAYAWHRGGYPEKAAEEVAGLMAISPHDPYFLELKGQILLESGKPKEAIPELREAVAQSRSSPLIASLLGDALVASEDPANLKEAAQVLKVAVQRDNENPQAWYNLGLIYTRLGDEPRASLASAERWSLEGNPRLAMANAEAAMRGIPVGTPDYIRAQDLALTARDEAQQKRRR